MVDVYGKFIGCFGIVFCICGLGVVNVSIGVYIVF